MLNFSAPEKTFSKGQGMRTRFHRLIHRLSPGSVERVAGVLLVLVLVLVLVTPLGARAGEFPDDRFGPRGSLERKFREARALEGEGSPEAVKRYRELARADSFPAADAVHSALARLGGPREAERHWTQVLAFRPKSPFAREALQGLRALYVQQGRFAEAEEVVARLLEGARGDRERAAVLGAELAMLEKQGRHDELREAARRLWLDYPQAPEARAAEARVAAGGNPFDAVPADELLARGKRLVEKGSREEAVRTLREAQLRLEPESPLLPEADLALGKALVLSRRFDEARDALAQARLDPKREEEARYQTARALFGLNRGDEGARELVALARRRPGAGKGADYLLQAQKVFTGRNLWRQARRAETLLLRRYPRSAEARELSWAKGWSAFLDRRFAEASSRFWSARQGLGREWFQAQLLYWEGSALVGAGDQAEGRALLQQVARGFPLGYYGRLAERLLEARPAGPEVADARVAAGGARTVRIPGFADEGGEGAGPLAAAETYLRLGLPAAAREVLRGAPPGARKSRLLYWAEDFAGALSSSGKSWLDWPEVDPSPLDLEGLAYPLAYPKSASEAAKEAGIHPHLLLAIAHTESHFDPGVFSVAEARGLMQFIPATGAATARALGVPDFSVDRLYEPRLSLRLGARHLRELLDHFRGDTIAAVAAYNAGAGAVERWKGDFGGRPPAEFVESIPYKETRRYVKKVLTALDAYGRLDPPALWGGGAVTAKQL